MTKILMASATGMVGAATLTPLLADNRVEDVVAPTRRPIRPHAKLLNPIMISRELQTDAAWWAVAGAILSLVTMRANAGSDLRPPFAPSIRTMPARSPCRFI
jgi:hypothetical protein